MRRFLYGLFTGGIFGFLASRLRLKTVPDRETTTFRLSVEPEGETWKVVYRGEEPFVLIPGDKVIWALRDGAQEGPQEVHFQFPLLEHFEELRRKESWTAVITPKEPLTLTVAAGAPAGEYVYAAFVRDAVLYAEGDSPPTMKFVEY